MLFSFCLNGIIGLISVIKFTYSLRSTAGKKAVHPRCILFARAVLFTRLPTYYNISIFEAAAAGQCAYIICDTHELAWSMVSAMRRSIRRPSCLGVNCFVSQA
jgi:hypothetical protein